MKYYSMTLTWEITCRFGIRQWYSQTLTTFIIGCAVTMLLAFLTMALPKIKKSFETILFRTEVNSSFEANYHQLEGDEEERKNSLRMSPSQLMIRRKVIPAFYAIFYAFLHVALMIVMMSMNGYVILAIIVGFTLGFAVFSDPPCSNKTEKSCAKGCS